MAKITTNINSSGSGGGGTVTGVTAVSPIISSGGTAPIISTSISTNKLIGRYSTGTGVFQEITLGTGLSFSGNTLNASSSSTPTLQQVLDNDHNLVNGKNFQGSFSGLGATSANQSNFFGSSAGYYSSGASNSNFFGDGAGFYAPSANNSNFFGGGSGYTADNANNSNFFGETSGYDAKNAKHSNFLGYRSGYLATGASYSNLFGYNVGNNQYSSSIGTNNIIIGTNISLPASTSNAINIGGVLFGTGTYYEVATTSSSIVPATNGRIGIGVVTPSTRLHVYSETANTSGLRLQRLTSASPTSTGQAIGVDANGNVITVASGSGGSQNLQQVLDEGNTATKGITITVGDGGGDGIHSFSSQGYGVYGSSSQNNGIYGTSTSAAGVYGISDNYGVRGYSENIGVYGDGINLGVVGSSGAGTGIYANSDSGTGLYANSDSGTGLYSYSESGAGISAYSNLIGLEVNGNGTIAIKANLGNSNKGLVINSGTSSTGNFIELNKNGVDKLTINQQGELSVVKIPGGTSSQILAANGSVITAGTNITISGGTISSSGGGGSSPLTTKGDLYTFSTVDARLPIGTDGQILTANSGVPKGLSWQDNYADWTSTVKHIVKNNGLSGTITKGTAVYVTSSDGTNMLVGRASNVSEPTSSKTMGLMQSNITTTGGTQTGFVITEGLLGGLNTAGATAGDPVWLGVDGALIYGLINKPYAPNHLVFIGIVTKVSAGNGEIFVKVQNGFELKELHDVQAQSPTLKDTLWYDNTVSPAQWKTASISTVLGYTPANDANVVHLTGNETISGLKTFTDNLTAGRYLYSGGSIFPEFGQTFYINGTGATHYFGGGASNAQNNLEVSNGTLKIGLQTASTIASFDANKNVVSLTTANGYPTLTELKSLVGVSTTTIQTQLNSKQDTLSGTGFVKSTAGTISYDTNTYYLASNPSGFTNNLGTVTSVTGTAPVVSSGGTTPAISMAAATTSVDGYLTSTDWTTFNNKQDKSLSAYTVMANNTASTANATAQTFRNESSKAYTGTTPTWTGTTAPSGTTNHTYSWNRIGNLVTLRISLDYATAGTLVTQVTFDLPSDCPTPELPSGVSASADVINYGSGMLTANRNVPASPTAAYSCIRIKSSGVYEINIGRGTAASHKYAYATIQYFV